MERLYDIGVKYGIEKLGNEHGTDKTVHRYLGHYEAKFEGRRNNTVSLLEIGVMKGSSLRMWRDYFPNGQIYGIDAVEESIYTEERIQCFLGTQENARFLAGVIQTTGPLDIVIDDGGHQSIQHVASFEALWQHIKPGGWYCIEDCFSIFNDCWTQPEDRTILDVLQEQWRAILTGVSDIAEVDAISDGQNDGLICFRKRAPLLHPSEV